MNLSGNNAKIRLSVSGLAALKGVLGPRIGRSRVLRAIVLENDASGLWIDNRRFGGQRIEVLLIKWEHVETVGFEASLTEGEEAHPIGFR